MYTKRTVYVLTDKLSCFWYVLLSAYNVVLLLGTICAPLLAHHSALCHRSPINMVSRQACQYPEALAIMMKPAKHTVSH